MQVLPTLHSALLRLFGVPTIRIPCDICVAAVVDALASFIITVLFENKWEWFVLHGVLGAALIAFVIGELNEILKQEIGVDIKKIGKMQEPKPGDNTEVGPGESTLTTTELSGQVSDEVIAE